MTDAPSTQARPVGAPDPDIDGAVSFLSGHGDADEAHTAALKEVLLRIDDAADGEAIVLAAGLFRRLYPRFFAGPRAASRSGAGEDRP